MNKSSCVWNIPLHYVSMCHSAWFNEEAAWSMDGQDKVVGEPNKESWEEG